MFFLCFFSKQNLEGCTVLNMAYTPIMPPCDEVHTKCKDSFSTLTSFNEVKASTIDNDISMKNSDNCFQAGSTALSDFLDSSSDDDGLLEKVIESAIPKNK